MGSLQLEMFDNQIAGPLDRSVVVFGRSMHDQRNVNAT